MGLARLRSTLRGREWGLDVEQVDVQGADDRLVVTLQTMTVERWDALVEAFVRAEGASGGWLPVPFEGPDDGHRDEDELLVPRLDAEARALVEALRPFVDAAGVEPGAVSSAVLEADLDQLTELTPGAALQTVAAVLDAGRADEGTLLSAFESGAMQTLVDRVLRARPV